jgi:fumarate hydratase subunit alpha
VREVDVAALGAAVSDAAIEACYRLPPDVVAALRRAAAAETCPPARRTLELLLENAEIAAAGGLAICQDTGMAVVFLELGQDVRLCGGDLRAAVDDGVRHGYTTGFLRKSVVDDPLLRNNTGDNTPAILHIDIVPGDGVRVTVAPKGFGSENMSGIAMLAPADGVPGIRRFVRDLVRAAGGNPCPPLVVGVGIGGTMETAAGCAKRALLRPLGTPHRASHVAALEADLLADIQATGVGPGGLGGDTTALAVAVETYPTHIAALPVAVNLSCHALRRATREL